MKNIKYFLAIALSIATIFTACTNNNNENELFDNVSVTNTTESSIISAAFDIPAQYDSVGMAFGEYLTTVSLALIDKGIANPTIDDIKHEAKKYYKDRYADFDTAVIDNFDESAISTDNVFLSEAQQETLDKINKIISNTGTNLFEQEIPSMVALINTLPQNERGSLFIYIATIKYGVIADSNINTAIAALVANGRIDSTNEVVTQGFWSWLGNAFCAVWRIGRYFAIISPGGAAVPFIDGACLAYVLAQLVNS